MKKIIKGKNDVSIAVEDIGDGQPIIFLHGWPFDHQMFEYQYNYFLPRGYRVIGVDFRGFGDSNLVIEEYGYDTLADDIKLVLEELQIEEAILVGFSMGGAVATHYMARHQGFGIKKLILISAAVPQFAKTPAYSIGIKKLEITSMIDQIQIDRPKMIQDFIKKLFHEKTYVSYKDWLTSLALRASSYGMILAALAMRDENVQADLEQITVPTLICHGEKDTVCSYEVVEEMTQLILKNIVVPFRKSGHAIFHDETDKLNRTMLMFIQNKN
ncbi:alpha/beta fold hydrolase [Carnobacterium alterfunditum]|uniref:alpha/beta fold hydrolase n=1 Tax=Carnobacterium alterfunditum TaxID=28230 RepID=UPI0035941B6E